MGFWIFMFICTLLIPIIMVAVGRAMYHGKFSTINSVAGYRTRRSMKNQQTWDFAHRECGRLWRRWGWVSLAVTVIMMLPFWGKSENLVGTAGAVISALQLILLLASIAVVEHRLKQHFDDNGSPRA